MLHDAASASGFWTYTICSAQLDDCNPAGGKFPCPLQPSVLREYTIHLKFSVVYSFFSAAIIDLLRKATISLASGLFPQRSLRDFFLLAAPCFVTVFGTDSPLLGKKRIHTFQKVSNCVFFFSNGVTRIPPRDGEGISQNWRSIQTFLPSTSR